MTKSFLPFRETTDAMEAQEYTWETCKENVQPIKRGRSARGLGTAVGCANSGVSEALSIQGKSFEQTIADIASRNPQSKELLDTYAQFFKWTRDSFPSSSDKAQLVLEVCLSFYHVS